MMKVTIPVSCTIRELVVHLIENYDKDSRVEGELIVNE